MNDNFNLFDNELIHFLERRRNYIRRHFNPLWCSWFTGLIDGEGYFHLVSRHTRKGFETELVINLRIDDYDVLEEIHRTLRIGKLYEIDDETQRRQGYKASDRIRWRCTKIKELTDVLIPIFEEYPLHSKKSVDYKVWREAVFIRYKNTHLTTGYNKMLDLVSELKIIRNNTPLNNRHFVRENKKAR